MIISRYRALLVGAALIAGSAVTGVVGGASAAGAVVRYASPSGVASANCARTAPCDLVTAINDAPDGAQVVIESGSYDKSAPLTTVLKDQNGTLDIDGPARGPRPVIYSSASPSLYFSASNVSDLDVVSSSAGTGLLDYNGTVSRVDVLSSGQSACAAYHALIDSLCVASSNAGVGIELENTGGLSGVLTRTVTLRGDTVVGAGQSGAGLRLDASGMAATDVTATNDIFQGHLNGDVASYPAGADATTSVTLLHSDYVTSVAQPSGGAPPGSAVISGNSTDIRTAPEFVDAATGNYQEKAGSPTINAGTKDAAGDTDLDGVPRTSGGTPDIGAYEVAKKPATGKLKIAKRKPTSVGFTLRLNDEGLSTTVRLTASHGSHHVRRTYRFGVGAKPVTRKLWLRGLKPHTTYRVSAVAANLAGTTKAGHRKARTT